MQIPTDRMQNMLYIRFQDAGRTIGVTEAKP